MQISENHFCPKLVKTCTARKWIQYFYKVHNVHTACNNTSQELF